jgi:hypothetical protein
MNVLAEQIKKDCHDQRPTEPGFVRDVYDAEIELMDFESLANAVLNTYVPEYRPNREVARIDR